MAQLEELPPLSLKVSWFNHVIHFNKIIAFTVFWNIDTRSATEAETKNSFIWASANYCNDHTSIWSNFVILLLQTLWTIVNTHTHREAI